MISDDERREVAARLREIKPEKRLHGYARVEDVFGACGINSDFGFALVDELGRLADLIDRPTCRIGYVPCSADRSCSACGVTFSTGTYQGGDHEEHEFMFCPNCGAQVEDDAEPSLKEN